MKFMEEQLEGYATAIIESRENDFVLDVQRRYFKRFPLSLPHDIEPSKESLDTLDDNAPDPEIKEPNQKDMSGEEYKAAKNAFDHNCALLQFRKEVSCHHHDHMLRLHIFAANSTLAKVTSRQETSLLQQRSWWISVRFCSTASRLRCQETAQTNAVQSMGQGGRQQEQDTEGTEQHGSATGSPKDAACEGSSRYNTTFVPGITHRAAKKVDRMGG
jgi:hypothetical protein